MGKYDHLTEAEKKLIEHYAPQYHYTSIAKKLNLPRAKVKNYCYRNVIEFNKTNKENITDQ